MSIFHYEIFNAVVSQKSFAKAAEILNITPSAISHSISKFEKAVGFPLFTRNRMGVQLTHYGEEILPYVQAILKDDEHLTQLVSKLNGLEKGSVGIGTFNSVCVNWMPDIIRSFSEIYPNIEIVIYQGGYDDVENWLNNSIVDLGFVSLSHASNFAVTPVYKDPLLCVVPKGFRCMNPNYVTIDDIRDQPFVYQREGYDAETNAFIKKHSLRVSSKFHVEDDYSLVAMIESGFGVSLIPELVMRKIQSNVDVYPIVPEEFRIIGLASLNNKRLSPAAQQFRVCLLSFLADHGIKNV